MLVWAPKSKVTISVLSGIVPYLRWPRTSETPYRLSVFHCLYSKVALQIRKTVKIMIIQSTFNFINADCWLHDIISVTSCWGKLNNLYLPLFPKYRLFDIFSFFLSDKICSQTSVLSFFLLPIRWSTNRECCHLYMPNLPSHVKNDLHTMGATKCLTYWEALELGLLQRTKSIMGCPYYSWWAGKDLGSQGHVKLYHSQKFFLASPSKSPWLYLCFPPALQV